MLAVGLPRAVVAMGDLGKAAAAELEALSEALRTSTLAATVLDLARRLDEEPTDRDAVGLARELRLALIELRHQSGGVETEQEQIVARLRTTALGH